MTEKKWHILLSQTTALKQSRLANAQLLLENPQLLKYTLNAIDCKNTNNQIKAAWILEMALRENIEFIKPELNLFFKITEKIMENSTKRSISKIFELLTVAHYNNPQLTLNTSQQKIILQISFNFLIDEEKVAVKVFAMQSLYYLSVDFDWVKTELPLQLKRMYPTAKPGFQSRARKILTALKNN